MHAMQKPVERSCMACIMSGSLALIDMAGRTLESSFLKRCMKGNETGEVRLSCNLGAFACQRLPLCGHQRAISPEAGATMSQIWNLASLHTKHTIRFIPGDITSLQHWTSRTHCFDLVAFNRKVANKSKDCQQAMCLKNVRRCRWAGSSTKRAGRATPLGRGRV